MTKRHFITIFIVIDLITNIITLNRAYLFSKYSLISRMLTKYLSDNKNKIIVVLFFNRYYTFGEVEG